jgi:hypothetical protein
MPRQGMTLFEIVISMALVATAFVVILSAIPIGLRLQEKSRFQLYASAKALDLITSFNTLPPRDARVSLSSVDGPWDAQGAYRPSVFDLEQRLGNQVNGLIPLPPDIARRIDSDDDEIQRLLATGAHLFYPSPKPTTGLSDVQTVAIPPSEARRLVVGIVGAAQDNQIPGFPNQAWPAYSAYPAPPDTGMGLGSLWAGIDPQLEIVNRTEFAEDATPVPWEGNGVAPHGSGSSAGAYWYSPSMRPVVEVVKERALRYMVLALWYAQQKSLPDNPWYTGARATRADVDALLEQTPNVRALQATAIRLLAHAGMVLTRHCSKAELDAGYLLPTYNFANAANGILPANVRVTTEMIANWHENCMDAAMAYASRLPYDWGIPRPYNRAIFSDAPLLQWDIWAPGNERFTGTILGSAKTAEQWKVLTPTPVLNGAVPGLPTLTMLASPAAATQRFNLTEAFQPSQRCRELVFWSVDWQSYEDFESASSAAVDASRYILNKPRRDNGQLLTWNERMRNSWKATQQGANIERPSFRNPERKLLFLKELPTLAPGASEPMGGKIFGEERLFNEWWDKVIPDIGNGDPKARTTYNGPGFTTGLTGGIFSGIYGADRNGNGSYDRGLRPAAQRLRATTIARFIVYDPRLPMLLR